MLKLEKDVFDFNNPNIAAILPLQMNEFYDYFLNTYKNNTRFEFLRFLLDKGIDVNELFDERYEMNFFVNLGYRIDGDEKESHKHICEHRPCFCILRMLYGLRRFR